MEPNQNVISMPRIGDQAPAFKAVTTQGNINFPEDYKGKWVILFSHPADFTPVCTSEFMTFAKLEKEFEQANCKLVGLSVDGLFSHIAWLRTIKEKIEYKVFKTIDRSKIIKQIVNKLKQFSKVSNAWIYGSFSREDDGPGSDIDIAVKTDEGFSYFDLAEIQYQLENEVNRKIDVGFIDSFKPHIFKNVESDLKMIYER